MTAAFRWILLILLGLGLGGPGSAWADSGRVIISPGLNSLDLSPHLGYLVDPEGRMDASSAYQAAAQGSFKPLPNGSSTFGFKDGAYWFHARLFNQGNSEERWLLVLQYSLLDNVDVYMRHQDGRVDHLASGDMLPFSARAIRYRHPNFWLDLPQRSEVELLVRAQSKSSMQVPLKIHTFGAFAEMERDAQIGIGVYDGILLALLFYNMLLWLSLRDSSHFWYMCHLAGFGTGAVLPQRTWPSNICGRRRPGWRTMPSRWPCVFRKWRCTSSPDCSWNSRNAGRSATGYRSHSSSSMRWWAWLHSGSITAPRCSWEPMACSPACWPWSSRPIRRFAAATGRLGCFWWRG